MAENKVYEVELLDQEGNSLTINQEGKKERQQLRTFLDKKQVLDKLRSITNPRNSVLITTLYMTGLRVSEIINIKKEDIDFKEGYITVRWQKNRKWKNRKVPLHNQLAPILSMYSAKLTGDSLLFPISRQRVYQITKKHFGVSPHKFRHTYAMLFLRESDDPLKYANLKELLGHKNLNTTMEYVRLAPEHTKKAISEVDFL